MSNHPEHYAVIIAVEEYLHFPAAQRAIESAKSFAEWLKSENGGGLPEANVRMFISPVNLQEDLFNLWNSELQEDIKKGTRLYFYFSGLACGQTFDSTVMLTADASEAQLNGFSLRGSREFFQKTGAFDEVIYILDSPRVPVMNTGGSFASTFAITSGKYSRVTDFILIAGSYGGNFEQVSTKVGHLTATVLDGLSGKAADPLDRVTAVSLSQYVQSQPETLSTISQDLPEALLPTEEMILVTVPAQREKGTLVIELPHQFAAVRIYNNLLRYVGRVGPAIEDSTMPGTYTKRMLLAPGIYKVEVFLEDQSDHQFVSVLPNQVSRIDKTKWKEFKLTATAPLLGDRTSRDSHVNPAVEWSKKLSWTHPTGGNSRLFIFFRTLEVASHKDFTGGLRLLDEHENEIVDVPANGELNLNEGWMAFCSDVPQGFYILRRGKRGVPICHLPVYLRSGYETQVFLKVDDDDSFPSMSLNMAPLGKGFEPADESTAAADAVLDAIKYGLSGRQIVTSEKTSKLIKQKLENPWLGILAAYVLSPSNSLRSSLRFSNVDPDISDLYNHVMGCLASAIPDHPDVRALNLKADKPADAPFHYPPLLRMGLSLVRQNAINYADTIPPGSLTDRVLSAEYVNMLWTNWGNLETTAKSSRKRSTKMRESGVFSDSVETTSYLQSISPKLPAFSFQELVEEPAASQSSPSSAKSGVDNVYTLRDAEIIHAAQQLTQTHDLDTIPEKVVLSPTSDLKSLIESIKPEEISSATEQPLSRVLVSMETLRKKSEEMAKSLLETGEVPLTSGEQAIVEFALLKTAREHRLAVLSSYANEDKNTESASLSAGCFVSIEDLVRKLLTEADSLVRNRDDANTKVPDNTLNLLKDLSDRLRAIAHQLQQRAAITIITDDKGHILRTNGAFVSIISFTEKELDKDASYQQLITNKHAWEAALPAAALGSSFFENPITEATPKIFKLRRTAIEDEASKKVVAYLNVLRGKDVPGLKQRKLEKFDSILSDLQIHVSIYIYDSSGNPQKHIEALQKCVEQLEQIMSNQTES